MRINYDPLMKEMLKAGRIGVMPTDTIYGLVGSALNKKTVETIYKVRQRNPRKPFIILISNIKDLGFFGIQIGGAEKHILHQLWPGKVSVILKSSNKKFEYLDRGTRSLAFRLPKDRALISLIKFTGPLVAPSANLEGKPEAKNIKEAVAYFGDNVDFYLDAGTIRANPSTLVSLVDGELKVLRGKLKSIKIKPQ